MYQIQDLRIQKEGILMSNLSCPRVDIGGQAVMEGVMMRGPHAIAIAVRRPDQTIVVQHKKYVPLSEKHKWMG